MENERPWKRIRERLELQLPVRVQCRETSDFEWVEITRLINVTPFGAGFTLKRPIEKGRLLQMTIPMPRQLRVFDHVEDQYRVWALVRYVRSPELCRYLQRVRQHERQQRLLIQTRMGIDQQNVEL